ncbi:MAG: hypothetical protein IPP72_19030 [Chitinophagaceae bacterium]|nr:hypothetical protein [Chitinophagaceae bacterium]
MIIIELIGSGATFGYDETAIQKKLELHGFAPYVYEPFARNWWNPMAYQSTITCYT